MKIGMICLAFQFALASADALAQAQVQDKGDAIERLRACSALARAERLECLDKLSRDVGSASGNPKTSTAPEVAPAADSWIVSETTSPLDYSPIAIATATAGGASGGATMQLSIQCRGGRTDLVIASAALTLRGEDYIVSYEMTDGRPVVLPSGMPVTGAGVAIKGDVVRLLTSLPDHGDISIRVAARQGVIVEGRYALAGLKAVRSRIARPCKWPAAGGPTK